jgi:hypothetical protein
VTYNLASDIAQDGKFIAAQIKKARQYEAQAEEKAGTDLRKAADHWATVYQRLADVKKKCKQAGMKFDDFKAEHCPDLGRSQLYKALAIADGRTTIEQEKERDAKRQAAKRAKDEALSVTPNVTDSLPDLSPAEQEQATKEHIAKALETYDPPEGSEVPSWYERHGVSTEENPATMFDGPPSATSTASPPELTVAATNVVALEQPTVPAYADRTLADWKADLSVQMTEACSGLPEEEKTELLEFLKSTIEGLGLSGTSLTAPLQGFKNDCDKWLPLMSDDERRKARIQISEWKPKRSKVAA